MNLTLPYLATIPYPVLADKTLDPQAKIFYGCLVGLARKFGYCWAKDEELAEMMEVATQTIKRWLKDLEDAGHVFRQTTSVTYRDDQDRLLWKKTRKIWISPGFSKKDSESLKNETFDDSLKKETLENKKYSNNELPSVGSPKPEPEPDPQTPKGGLRFDKERREEEETPAQKPKTSKVTKGGAATPPTRDELEVVPDSKLPAHSKLEAYHKYSAQEVGRARDYADYLEDRGLLNKDWRSAFWHALKTKPKMPLELQKDGCMRDALKYLEDLRSILPQDAQKRAFLAKTPLGPTVAYLEREMRVTGSELIPGRGYRNLYKEVWVWKNVSIYEEKAAGLYDRTRQCLKTKGKLHE